MRLVLLLAAGLFTAQVKPDAGGEPPPDRRLLEPVSGRIAAADRKQNRFTLETPSGTETLSYDRNTTVFLPGRVGSVLDLVPGAEVRVARDAAGRAAWIDVEGRDRLER